MAVIALVTANRVHIEESREQMTLPAGGAISAGDVVRIDPTTGKFVKASGSNQSYYGIAAHTVVAGQGLTAIRKGVMEGFDFTSQAYDAKIYVSDTGVLADTAGTTTVVVGQVIPVFGQLLGNTPDKLLRVDL